MKRNRGGSAAVDLKSFLQRVAAKKKPLESEVVAPPTNENQRQIVVFQGQSSSGTNTIPLEAERDEQQQQPPANPSIIEDDESMPIDESDSGDEDGSNYNIEHDPGLSMIFWATCIFVEYSRHVLQENPHASHSSS